MVAAEVLLASAAAETHMNAGKTSAAASCGLTLIHCGELYGCFHGDDTEYGLLFPIRFGSLPPPPPLPAEADQVNDDGAFASVFCGVI